MQVKNYGAKHRPRVSCRSSEEGSGIITSTGAECASGTSSTSSVVRLTQSLRDALAGPSGRRDMGRTEEAVFRSEL